MKNGNKWSPKRAQSENYSRKGSHRKSKFSPMDQKRTDSFLNQTSKSWSGPSGYTCVGCAFRSKGMTHTVWAFAFYFFRPSNTRLVCRIFKRFHVILYHWYTISSTINYLKHWCLKLTYSMVSIDISLRTYCIRFCISLMLLIRS